MSDIQLGKLIVGRPYKDAIHVAVAPVIADVRLKPGQHVGLTKKNGNRIAPSDNPIGVVDPYLDCDVFPDQSCWIMLYPNTVMSLRHEWIHPAFGGDSYRWLQDIANECDLEYSHIMDAGREMINNGHYTLPSDHAMDVLNDKNDEFWHHFEVVTGIKRTDKDTFFNCAC